tara:strand:- start:478 stop:726 length:249 start_codon:yes stop_codon:yes gene_type:complete
MSGLLASVKNGLVNSHRFGGRASRGEYCIIATCDLVMMGSSFWVLFHMESIVWSIMQFSFGMWFFYQASEDVGMMPLIAIGC